MCPLSKQDVKINTIQPLSPRLREIIIRPIPPFLFKIEICMGVLLPRAIIVIVITDSKTWKNLCQLHLKNMLFGVCFFSLCYLNVIYHCLLVALSSKLNTCGVEDVLMRNSLNTVWTCVLGES